MRVAFVGHKSQIARVFGSGRRSRLESLADVIPGVLSPDDERLAQVEAIFSTWGMPLLTSVQLDAMPKLKAVFYAAGAVGYFSEPLVQRGIKISSAWQANAVPVAEFTVAQVLLACKAYFTNIEGYRRDPAGGFRQGKAPGVYGETVALLGVGAIGTRVIEFLRPFRLNVIVFDPFLTDERAEILGVRKVSLQSVFAEGYVVSNHLLDVPDTYGLVGREQLESMREGATFLNTGRGRTVIAKDLIAVLKERPDLTAILDVTDPEPVPADHDLWTLPNAVISSHIAGSIGDEVLRMADFAIEDFERFLKGQPIQYEVFC